MVHCMITAIHSPAVGDFRSFGAFGPKYEIKRILTDPNTGKEMCDICVLESGERVIVPLARVAEDPEAI